jgi:CspA family cold shock protein
MTTDNEKYDGVVIWYNERRGYGFVRFDKNEIFLHHSASSLCRLETVYPGDQLTVNLSENDSGPVIKEILLHLTDEGKGPQAKEVKVVASE